MPVDDVQSGEVFTVRTYKSYVGFAWSNTYEIQAAVQPVNSVTAVEAVASAFVNLERQLHIDGVIVDRVVVSTFVPDGQPYSPSAFTTIPFSLNSLRPAVAEVLPLELTLFVRRNSPTGRDGRLLYRGCLTENDMSASAFRPLLTPTAITNLQTIFGTWLVSVFPNQDWNLVMASGPSTNPIVRTITGFQVSQKIVVKKLNNRYYDRGTS